MKEAVSRFWLLEGLRDGAQREQPILSASQPSRQEEFRQAATVTQSTREAQAGGKEPGDELASLGDKVSSAYHCTGEIRGDLGRDF